MEFLDEQIKSFSKTKRSQPSSQSKNYHTSPEGSSKSPLHSRHQDRSPIRSIDSLTKRSCTPYRPKPSPSPLLNQAFQSPLLSRARVPGRPQFSTADTTPSHPSLQQGGKIGSPTFDENPPETSDRVGKLKTLNLNWKPFCKGST